MRLKMGCAENITIAPLAKDQQGGAERGGSAQSQNLNMSEWVKIVRSTLISCCEALEHHPDAEAVQEAAIWHRCLNCKGCECPAPKAREPDQRAAA